MATRASIEMDFQRAIGQANKLESIASRLDGLANNRLKSSMQTLAMGWKSESAVLYMDKGEKLKTKINMSASDLRVCADDIRKEAKRIYDAEMAALELAANRVY